MSALLQPVEAEDSEILPKLSDEKIVAPAAWKPGVVWDGSEGEITTRPTEQPTPHYEDILLNWGYDPNYFEIIEPVKVTSWDAQTASGTQQLWSYKAGVRKKLVKDIINYDELKKEIKKHRPLSKKLPDGDTWFIVNISDTQFGKHDGDGLKGTIDRFLNAIDSVERRIKDLRKIGVPLGNLLIAGVGDIVEACDGQYASQTFTVELNRREQNRVARRLIRDAIARWSKLFKNVIVTAVPGNHGEFRKDGKMFTEIGDNDDVAVFEALAEVFAFNTEAYGHVSFHLPKNEIYTMFDCDSINVAFAHGHIAKGGGTPQSRIKNWWADQSFGSQALGQAHILVTGHYHHTSLIQYGEKTHIQCPALDGGSEWFTNLSGENSPPGMLTFTVDRNGWSNLLVV